MSTNHVTKINPKKEALVADLKDKLTSAKGAVFTSYKGLTVAQDTALRRKLREAGVTYHVVKNTMTRLAADQAGLEGLDEHLEGTTALAISFEDVIAPAKAIEDFIKENKLEDSEVLKVKAGIVEGKVINEAEVKALASLPSREVLLAKLLGSMQAPISGTVNTLQGIIRNAVYVFEAVRQQKESA
ncbi:50S ribosomal protein L10 [Selenomonas sp. TAMA-11512]|uniref:50S ribosomal protein L10 n=1 Tax=Selenomonas sp. TAMA-11512 TaxID=3095337 RepID=UPI003087FD89|nr:50S ribosomal protein L10 [Selenomonas sp. TAMA-11512]